VDLTGKRFGALSVVSYNHAMTVSRRRVFWNVKCDCGTETPKVWTSIRDGKRCGRCTPVRHGFARRKARRTEYTIWANMIDRCQRAGNQHYDDYGGRGITVCERWQRFENFLEDMGPRPSASHTIERKNNDVGYELRNCEWSTRARQARNKRTTVWVRYGGKKQCLADACEAAGLSYSMVSQRLDKLGWSVADALTIPRYGRGANGR